MKEKTPAQIDQALFLGDHLTDQELINFYKEYEPVRQSLSKLGDRYYTSFAFLNSTLLKVESFIKARGFSV